jgi:hypothetical protein
LINKTLALKVLDFWHKVEFFQSADLDNLTVDSPGVIHYDGEELANRSDCLPWLNRQQIRRAGKGYLPTDCYAFKLFLGIFNRTEVPRITSRLFTEDNNNNNEEWQERTDDQGLTCCATLTVGPTGVVDLSSLEISTLPWALGQVVNNNFDAIQLEQFDQSVEALTTKLHTLVQVADNIKQASDFPPAFTAEELLVFLHTLADWSGFQPAEPAPALVIQLLPHQLASGASVPALNPLPQLLQQQLSNLPQRVKEGLSATGNQGEENLTTSKPSVSKVKGEDEVAILNSFYIRDIERAMQVINDGQLDPSSPLARFLARDSQTAECHKKTDLLTEAGCQLISQHLAIEHTPLGRWPGEDVHTMSLMQQFAINTIYQDLAEQGLFSVNGPPGTGKTTLLRDIIANNIVQRAAVLAELSTASDAFSETLAIKVNGEMKKGIKRLHPKLRGYEMVVISSNNTAVENITKELPQRKALGEAYQDLDYLRPVAQKLAAEHRVSKGQPNRIKALTEQQDCWGLIAAALGNSRNRGLVGKRLFFQPIDRLKVIGEAAANYRTLIAAIKQQQISPFEDDRRFKAAQVAFKQASAAVQAAVADIGRLQQLAQRQTEVVAKGQKLTKFEQALQLSEARLRRLQARRYPWRAIKQRYRHRALVAALTEKINQGKARLAAMTLQLQQAKQHLQQEQQRCAELTERYGELPLADKLTNFEDEKIQRQAFGHCQLLNKLRAELTARAFALHQAWLVASYRQNGFAPTLCTLGDLLSGKISEVKDALLLWQAWFMVVPVVSSTFASVANQFKHFGVGEIGWLFIDEAGQAAPQQAVGALLRAKRAVVVGDPLQIEPVFTIPPGFVEGFAKARFGHQQFAHWSPTVTSVQKLADNANPYGTRQIAIDEWLGSPLRVHRRCQEPMFSIANQIAYNGKMFHGAENPQETSDFIWGASSWFDIAGEIEGKHFVPQQAEFICQLLHQYVDQQRQLPDLYIISPFRKVKAGVYRLLCQQFRHSAIPPAQFKKWLQGRVGTVHTFQGKEEKYVIMVLGVSLTNPGASRWAAQKPNLLNVATTRAKKRFYIVGCKEVWSGLPYFSTADNYLTDRAATTPLSS